MDRRGRCQMERLPGRLPHRSALVPQVEEDLGDDRREALKVLLPHFGVRAAWPKASESPRILSNQLCWLMVSGRWLHFH